MLLKIISLYIVLYFAIRHQFFRSAMTQLTDQMTNDVISHQDASTDDYNDTIKSHPYFIIFIVAFLPLWIIDITIVTVIKSFRGMND